MRYCLFKVEKCVCALSLSSEELLGSFYILSLLHTFSSHVENMATKNWVWRPLHGLKYISYPPPPHSLYQREGMGLLEYQAMPSLRNVAHDGWLCTFIIEQQLQIPSARSWAALIRATGTVQKRQAVWPVHHGQNHTLPGHSPPASQAGHRSGPAL